MKRKWSLKKRIQCRQTGLSHSYSRWVSQFAALIITGPAPASAQASWTPSVVRTYRIRWVDFFISRALSLTASLFQSRLCQESGGIEKRYFNIFLSEDKRDLRASHYYCITTSGRQIRHDVTKIFPSRSFKRAFNQLIKDKGIDSLSLLVVRCNCLNTSI